MINYIKIGIVSIATLLAGLFGYQNLGANPRVLVELQGGTGTSTPSGVLYGNSGNIETVSIGDNLNFSGGILSGDGTASNPFNGLFVSNTAYIEQLAITTSATSTGNIAPGTHNTYNLGIIGTNAWKNIFASSTAYLDYVSSTAGNFVNYVSSTKFIVDNGSYLAQRSGFTYPGIFTLSDGLNSLAMYNAVITGDAFVSGQGQFGSTVYSDANNTDNLGAYSNAWKNIYASSTAYLNYVSSTLSEANNFSATLATATSTFAGGFAVETSGLVYNGTNVGIGTATPDAKLQLSDLISPYLNANPDFVFEGSSFPYTSGVGGHARIYSGTNGAQWQNTFLRFQTHIGNVNTLTDTMTLTDGNVGIGDTTPTYNLDVTGPGRFTTYVDAANFVATSTTATSTFAGGLAVETSGLIYDGTNVGIATSTPRSLLQVSGGASAVGTTSTMWVGDLTGVKGQICLGDSDGSGATCFYGNGGVLTAFATSTY